MNQSVAIFQTMPALKTMSSLDLLKIINGARTQFGESVIRANDFHNRMVDELEGDYYETFVVQNPNKTSTTAYLLNIDQCTLVSMRESKGVRRHVLAQLKALQLPQTLPEALRLAADLAEKNMQLENQIAVATPKAQALDRLITTDGLFGIREAAKSLKIQQKHLTQLLVTRKWAFRAKKSKQLEAYASRIEQGLLSHVLTQPMPDREGIERVYHQLKITAKGMAQLAGLLNMENNQ